MYDNGRIGDDQRCSSYIESLLKHAGTMCKHGQSGSTILETCAQDSASASVSGSSLLPTWYNELQHKFISTSTISKIPKYLRCLGICTVISAFILGIIIGLLIPTYLLPANHILSSPYYLFRIWNHSETTRPPVTNVIRLPAETNPVSVPSWKIKSQATLSAINDVDYVPRPKHDAVITPESVPVEIFDTVSFVPSIQRTHSVDQEAIESKVHKINTSIIADGIYWSESIENKIPYGYDNISAAKWNKYIRTSRVVRIEEGCGRMQNRLLTFENGSRSCCRYRQNVDQIQGEIFSFYLGRHVLNLSNLAPTTLSRIKPSSRQWSTVRAQLNLAQWTLNEDRVVVLTRFIPNLGPAYIPNVLRNAYRRLHPTDLISPKLSDLIDLAQWSDLIVFDYLTANLDRVVNNLYNLQWNPSMMEAPAHNLARDTTSGLLLFLDNESGLLHGYRLLDKYEQYHRAMLDALCVFRKSTADIIRRLHEKRNAGELLRAAYRNANLEFVDILPMLPEKSIKILNKRIARVHEQIVKCEVLYA